MEAQELAVGTPLLIVDIENTLAQHADGMLVEYLPTLVNSRRVNQNTRLLWVTFLIDEICAQHCDDGIRRALNSLPKDLAETFNRALARIVSRRRNAVAAKAFRWVAVAKRPMTLEELHEAIPIEIGQRSARPDRRVNGINQLASWCENLIHVDEELQTVQFPHQAIRQFIVEGPMEPERGAFHFDLAATDHYVGEICVTYLNFTDFGTTVARRSQSLHQVDPTMMAGLALSQTHGLSRVIATTGVLTNLSKNYKTSPEVDVIGALFRHGT